MDKFNLPRAWGVAARSHVSSGRASRLLFGTALAGIAAGLALPAQAQEACGAPVEGQVTCTPAGNPYATGIEYYSPPVDPARDPGLDADAPVYDLTVALEPGVAVETEGGLPGVALIGFNDGAVTLDAGTDTAITASGTGAIGVLGLTNYGDLTINTDSVVADGRASGGINANSNAGDITITGNTIAVSGNSSIGISANSYLGDVSIDVGTVTASGYYTGGINAYAANGDIAITADAVSTTGGSFYTYGSTAIEARAVYGSITMDLGTVSTEADYSNGINAVTFAGDGVVDVTADAITTSGTGSIGALLQGATVNLDVGTLTTQGDGAYGAVLFGTGAGGVTMTSTGTVSTSGEGAVGIYAKAYYGGDTNIDVAAVSTQGADSTGIYAYSQAGSVTVTAGDVTTVGDNSVGIQAAAYYDVAITSTGSVQTGGDAATGIDAFSLYGGITVNAATVTTTGDSAQGIHAYAQGIAEGTDVTVNVGSVTTSGAVADGIGALSLVGDVTVTSTGALSTTGNGSFGAYAFSLYGDSSITVNDVTTTGDDAVGVQAYGYNASVTVNGDVSTSGTTGAYLFGADGVQATAAFGTAEITVNGSVTTAGTYADGARARGYYGAQVTNAGTIATSGDFANGVVVDGHYGPSIAINTGAITTTGDFSKGISLEDGYGPAAVLNDGTVSTAGESSAGIIVSGYSDVVVQGTGSVTTSGNYSAGIGATTSYGTTSVTMGSVTTSGEVATAINAYATQGVTVNVGTVATEGTGSLGVLGGSYGDVRITAADVSTQGSGSDAIRAATFGEGSTIRIFAGDVSTAGANSNAITALGFGGDVLVRLTGAVSAAQDTAVTIQSAGDARVTLVRGASVTGAINGIETDAAGTTTITNAGTLNTGSGYAIAVSGGPAVVRNSGTINGRIQLSDGDDSVTNTGLFRASASSDFGAGSDVFTNSGRVLVDAPGTVAVSVTFTGLEAFANSGVVDLRNGTAGDQFTIPGSFTGSGASTLALDLAPGTTGAMVADRLNVGTAAGSTQIRLALGGTVYVTPGVTLVQASAASPAAAFALDPQFSEVGLVALDLVYDPATFAYQLVGTPGSGAYRAAKALEGAQNLWYRSADAVTAHLTSLRDGNAASDITDKGFWLQMSGGVDKRDENRTVTNFGVTHSYDLDYRQDYFGGQLGFDVGTMGENGGVVFGLTGGYLSSTLRFDDATRFEYDGVNVGAYASLRAGGFFANGLVKYDHYWIDAVSHSTGYRDKLGGDAIGAQAEAGFRFGGTGFFAEPLASIAYVRTSLDDLQALGQVLDYDRADGLRGKAGLRLGGTTAIGGGNVLTFYASGMAVKEFKGKDGATFVSGPYSLSLGNQRIGTYGQGTLGINVTSASGITGFIEGTLDASSDYSGAGGRAGIKIPF